MNFVRQLWRLKDPAMGRILGSFLTEQEARDGARRSTMPVKVVKEDVPDFGLSLDEDRLTRIDM